ncbi:MAG: hypothetical protein EOP08_10915 [Proteobacteria bacterium]|nr:MAG: hypothetical protein EOP08_10915 [Pseudomonadota bacterium]
MSTFVPRVRRSNRGFFADPGKQYDDGEAARSAERFATEAEARAQLAQELAAAVRPGDRVEVNGGSYPDVNKAAQDAPVAPSSDALGLR